MKWVYRSLLSVLFSMLAVCSWAQTGHALLIGIGDYPDGSGWNKIHGNNDIRIVDQALKRQGFVSSNIIQLIDSQATKSNILNAFGSLSEQCSSGDIVYIHFSGHGQQVTDINGDEQDGFDESWIPYDARKKYIPDDYIGQNHLIDDELNTILKGLRTRVGSQGKIIVIADACHSGSGSRGLGDDEEVYVRGTDEKFIIPGGGANIVRKEEPVYWLYVGACKPYQTNYEYKTADGVFYGSLSYVIANGNSNLVTSDYRDVINQWRKALVEITRYPQDMDDEGRPSRRSDMMF